MAFAPLISELLFRYPLGDKFVAGEIQITAAGIILAGVFGLMAGFVLPGIGCLMCLAGGYLAIRDLRWARRRGKGLTPYKKFWYKWHHLAGLLFGLFVLTFVFSGMMSLATLLTSGGAMERNEAAWGMFGRYVWPNAYVGYSFNDEISYLKRWIKNRLTFMDKKLLPQEKTDIRPVTVASGYNADVVVEALPSKLSSWPWQMPFVISVSDRPRRGYISWPTWPST